MGERARLKLVMVEDSPEDAELILHHLKQAGYVTDCVRVQDAAGLLSALEPPPDLILSDFNLPGFDALSALRIVKAQGLDIPFIIVSGAIGEDVAVGAMREGAADYLIKDRPARLGPAIERALAGKADRLHRLSSDAALRESEQRFRSVFEEGAIGIAIVNSDLRLDDANDTLARLIGVDRSLLIGRSLSEISHPEDVQRAIAIFRRVFDGEPPGGGHEQRLVTADGGHVWVQCNASLVLDDDGRPLYTICVVQDVSERRRVERELQHRAMHDALTDLPNRTLLMDRLRQSILGAQRETQGTAILIMDLDGFKEVNDTLGHSSGDIVLQQLARRLIDVTRESDTVARLGGDEFAIIPGQAIDPAGSEMAAQRVLDALKDPFRLGAASYQLSASVGIAIFPEHGQDAETLMRHADSAMYAAKRAHIGFALYSPGSDAASSIRLAVLSELSEAIDQGQLVLHYQPQVDMRTGIAGSFEALVRWNHPGRGLLGPDDFIPLAEQTDIIGKLTRWVIDNALAQARVWADAGLDVKVAVNLTPADLHDTSLPAVIRAAMERHGIQPSSLIAEITERAIMQGPAHVTLRALDDLGISISVDDFGTGYSALAYLRTIPVDEIKVDKSFVTRMPFNEDDVTIVRTIIDLGHNLRLRVLAEGVETARTWNLLAGFGCDSAQGHHMGRPMPADAVLGWVQESAEINLKRAATARG